MNILLELQELRKQLKEDITKNIEIYNSEIEDGRFPEKHQYKGQKIVGDFDCSYCEDLTSLEGAPDSVTGDFDCGYCYKLTSLEGAPDSVTGNFYCSGCTKLESLEGAPDSVTGNFYCWSCTKLESLEGAPNSVTGGFYCRYCTSLTSLEGAPDSTGDFDCSGCTKLTSLEGIGVKYLKQINMSIDLSGTPIKSHVLGLMKVKDLKEVNMDIMEVEEILNKHLKSGRNFNKCKSELKDAGLEEYAQL